MRSRSARSTEGTRQVQADDFNAIFEAMFEQSRAVLVKKADEYATDDRLHNFKKAAHLKGETPIEALEGMMVKHTVSLYDMMAGAGEGRTYPMEVWDEKIGDHLNYLILLKALVVDAAYPDNPQNFLAIPSDSPSAKAMAEAFEGYGPAGRRRVR